MILDDIVASRRRELKDRGPQQRAALEAEVAALGPHGGRGLGNALRAEGAPRLAVIAEFKRRSPSAGELGRGLSPAEVARQYEEHGAAALSILTNGPYFGGAPGDLVEARVATALPVLRKDFLLDESDVLESRVLGADAVLLIVRILEPGRLRTLIGLAASLGIEALVEAHDRREVEVALSAGATLIGINHRNLDTLAMDLSLSAGARAWVGPEIVLVGESGIRTADDVAAMAERGLDAILVGEALLSTGRPGAALRELLARSKEPA